MSGGWVPLEYFEYVVSGLLTLLGFLLLGITWRVYMVLERRVVTLETYFDPRNEELRRRLLVAEFGQLVSQLELRLGRDLEAKRSSIEGTITRKVNEVVEAVKK